MDANASVLTDKVILDMSYQQLQMAEWRVFLKKQTLLQWPGLVISIHELIEICGLFIQMGRSGIDQGVHHD